MTEKYKCGPTQSRYSSDPNMVDYPINCGVCDTELSVTRNRIGPRNFTESLGKIKTKHDFFVCPHFDEAWHKQATNLRLMAYSTSSAKLKTMFLEEANEIIFNREATIEIVEQKIQ